ncbi:hypothetical protein WBG99_09690 [Streptomyces sp. TG1A-60]|uniref:hypothetical protein n=1 Tax=Streptomyces sp. TG1A-60 TaxID=3129111 RepID=UPI0030CDC6A3
MFEYELQQTRSAELVREAEQHRRARAARRAHREAARESRTPLSRSASGERGGDPEPEGRAPRERLRRLRFPRAA